MCLDFLTLELEREVAALVEATQTNKGEVQMWKVFQIHGMPGGFSLWPIRVGSLSSSLSSSKGPNYKAFEPGLTKWDEGFAGHQGAFEVLLGLRKDQPKPSRTQKLLQRRRPLPEPAWRVGVPTPPGYGGYPGEGRHRTLLPVWVKLDDILHYGECREYMLGACVRQFWLEPEHAREPRVGLIQAREFTIYGEPKGEYSLFPEETP